MRWRLGPAAIGLALALAARVAGQDDPGQPLTGVRGEPTRRGTIDLRQPLASPAPLAPQQPEAIHPPMPPQIGRAHV